VFVDAITLMKQYFQKGWFGGSVQKFFSNRFDPIDSMLGNGKAAMDMEGSWQFQNWPNFFGPKGNNNNDWDWAPIPPLRDGLPSPIFALGIGSTLSIKARTKVANAAATYMDWEFSDPKRVGQEMADVYNEPLPIHLAATDIPANADKRFPLSYVALNQATTQGVFGYTTWTFWPPKSDVWVYQGMEKVLTGDITPAAYLTQLEQIFKEELAKGVVPPIPKGKNG
jgi:raffinose/stachyose/melibiose transport system substrate-binding protein